MYRRFVAVVAVIAVAGLLVAPAADAKKAKKKSVELTHYFDWYGDCTGSGFLNRSTPKANEDACALFFPGLGDTYTFTALQGKPFTLDATKPVVIHVAMSHAATAAAEFEVVLTGNIKGQNKVIASGTQTVTSGSFVQDAPLHYELKADSALHKAKMTSLSATLTWKSGVSYSQVDFSGPSTIVLNEIK